MQIGAVVMEKGRNIMEEHQLLPASKSTPPPYGGRSISPCSSYRFNTSPINRPEPPTPYKMSSGFNVPSQHGQYQHRRRPSSIPRPISSLARSRRVSPLNHSRFSPLEINQRSGPQSPALIGNSTHQPRLVTEDNVHRTVEVSQQRDKPPRSDSYLPEHHRIARLDLSGVRQQLHIRKYSTQSVASVNSSNVSAGNTSTLTSKPMARSLLPKSRTMTTIKKPSINITPQRQLMQPLGPPMPRSQTSSKLSCFAGAGTAETPSPRKSESSSTKTITGSEVGVVDALRESRMSEHEVNVMNDVTKEYKMNLERVARTYGFENDLLRRRTIDDEVKLPRRPDAVREVASFSVAGNEDMDKRLLRRSIGEKDGIESPLKDGRWKKSLQVDTRLANTKGPQSVLGTVPDSGKSFASASDRAGEVNVKLVHFHQEIPYWTGRFSSLCDMLRNSDGANSNTLFPGPSETSRNPQESFEEAERRRIDAALAELRVCCRSRQALRSFEAFETQLRPRLHGIDGAPRRQLTFYLNSADSKGRLAAAGLKPRMIRNLGLTHGSPDPCPIPRQLPEPLTDPGVPPKPKITKSLTTSNLTSLTNSSCDFSRETMQPSLSTQGITSPSSSNSSQRPTYLEAQAHAKRVREQRVFARAEASRRLSAPRGTDVSSTNSLASDLTNNSLGKTVRAFAQGSTNQEHVEAISSAPDSTSTSASATAWTSGNSKPLPDEPPTPGASSVSTTQSRKSSGASAEMLKRVFTDGVRSVKGVRRRIGRSFTGSSDT